MSKAIITIEDSSEMGVHVSLEFDPPMKNDPEENMTPSQHAAMVMLEALKSDDSVDEISDEETEFGD